MSKVIKIKIHDNANRKLRKLVRTGLFGLNPEEAAERLFCRGLSEAQWLIDPKTKKP